MVAERARRGAFEWIVPLDHIKESGLDLSTSLPFDTIQGILPDAWTGAQGPVAFSVRLERHGDGVFAAARVHGRLLGSCGRCGADLEMDLDERYSVAYAPDEEHDLRFGDGLPGGGKGRIEWYPLREDALDLEEPLRDALGLGVTDYPRCAEGACDPDVARYLVSGDEGGEGHREKKGVDPRLAKLAEWKDKLSKS